MPSQRKRIGFLPRLEVQCIIDQICKDNKLSQSKVTGILVEEALNSRGMLNSSVFVKSYNQDKDFIESFFNNNKHQDNDNFNLDEVYINDEVKMINEFIEYKFFKNIMNKNKKKFTS